MAAATQSLLGAKYVPVLYCGEQPVHGVNYMIVCEQTLAAQGVPKHLIKMVVNSFCLKDEQVTLNQKAWISVLAAYIFMIPAA